jgi:hypothetical protein
VEDSGRAELDSGASGCVEGAQTVACDLMGSCCNMKTVLSSQLYVDTMSEMENRKLWLIVAVEPVCCDVATKRFRELGRGNMLAPGGIHTESGQSRTSWLM